jgi:uncharacterized protein YrzB (UPF0473 family)
MVKKHHRSAMSIAYLEKQLHESDEEISIYEKDGKMVNVDVVFCVDSDWGTTEVVIRDARYQPQVDSWMLQWQRLS